MARFKFDLATPADDEGLRTVLRETTMPGRIGLQFLREPSYFDGNCVLGPFHQTIVCRDRLSGEIVGFGCRSVRDVQVDGRVQPVGYLSMLRLKPDYRSLGLISRGYRFFRELHGDGRANFYLTTIAEGNEQAIRLLTSGRAGLPRYDYQGNYRTFAIPSGRRLPGSKSCSAITTRSASESDLDAIVEFLGRQSAVHRYFPHYSESDFMSGQCTFRNIAPHNIVLAINENDSLVGMMALWDQRCFRQTVISSYQGMLNRLRGVYNVWARLTKQIQLPGPGQPLNYGFVALPMVVDDRPGVFELLLAEVLEQASWVGLDYVLLGYHESDPLWSTAHKVSARHYDTRLYRVSWNGERPENEPADLCAIQNPYLELGCL